MRGEPINPFIDLNSNQTDWLIGAIAERLASFLTSVRALGSGWFILNTNLITNNGAIS